MTNTKKAENLSNGSRLQVGVEMKTIKACLLGSENL